MTIKRWDGSSWVDVASLKRWDGSSWVTITSAKKWDGSNWVTIALPGGGGSPLSLTLSPGYAYGNVGILNPPYPSARTVYSNIVTANIVGGTGPVTITWSRVSGNSGTTATSPSGISTQFVASVLRNNEVQSVHRCTVTKGAETATADVRASLYYTAGDQA